MRTRLAALAEVLAVYLAAQALVVLWRATPVVRWELRHLAWTYTACVLFAAVPALAIWLGRRGLAEYGVTTAGWPSDLDVGIKAFLVGIIPVAAGLGPVLWLGLDYRALPGGAIHAAADLVAIAVLLRVLSRHREEAAAASARSNLLAVAGLLLLPVVVALVMGKLTLALVSTVVWQLACSGFGEELVFRGYVQSRLNQAFGRPYQLAGIRFGPGLVVAALLFGLMHAFNTVDLARGQHTLAWGWTLFTVLGGVFFGLVREKTGGLLGCSLAHGLVDAVGEPLGQLMGWT